MQAVGVSNVIQTPRMITSTIVTSAPRNDVLVITQTEGTPFESLQCATRDLTARPRPPHSLPTFFFQRRISTSGLSTIKHTITKACSHSACKKSMQHSATFQSEVRRGTQHVTSMHNSSHFHNQPISDHHGTTAHAQTAANSQPNPAASAPIPRPRHLGPPTLHCS